MGSLIGIIAYAISKVKGSIWGVILTVGGGVKGPVFGIYILGAFFPWATSKVCLILDPSVINHPEAFRNLGAQTSFEYNLCVTCISTRL